MVHLARLFASAFEGREPFGAPPHGNGFVNPDGYRLLKGNTAAAMSVSMSTKFASRFRRRGATVGPTPSAEPAPSETVGIAIAEEAAGPTKIDPAPIRPEPAKPEAAADARPGPAGQSGEPAAPSVAPARLVELDKPKAAPEPVPAAAWLDNAHAYRIPAAAAVALVAALFAGYGLGSSGKARDVAASARSAAVLVSTIGELREAHGQIGKLAAEVNSLKGALEGLQGDRERSRGDILEKQTQLSERIERSGQENATRIGRLAEQLDRIEKTQREGTRPAASEKVASAPLPPVKPHLDVGHTGSLGDGKPETKPDPRKVPLEGYIVRDYDDGYALIETRSGRYIDVAVGYTLPGIGKVEAIERRGRQWVVVTPKGYIGER